MKLFDKKLERLALKTITSAKPSAMRLFANLSEEHFQDIHCLAVFKRIKKVVHRRSEIMSWESILEDSVIPEKSRMMMGMLTEEPKVNQRRCEEIFDNLENYRKTRIIYNGVKDIPQWMVDTETLDISPLIDNLSDVITKARAQADDDHFHVFGKGNNVDGVVERILSEEGPAVVPTGFKAWDTPNRGIRLGSVFFMGATTSGYKSLLSKCVLDNMADHGAKCCFVSLEMDEDEMFMRDLSRMSQVSMTKLFDPDKMTDEDRSTVRKAYKKRKAELEAKGQSIYLKVPKGNPSIEELLVQLKPHGFDVICVDYISLLKGVNEEEQWKKLGAITAFAKTFARNNKCIVILLGQVSAEAKIRYSGGILENVDVAWIWVKNQTVIDTKILEVDAVKARQQRVMKFKLFADPEFATIKDVPKDYKVPQVDTLAKKSQDKDKFKKRGEKPQHDNDDLMSAYFGKKKAA